MATRTSHPLRPRVVDLALTLLVACATVSIPALPADAGCGCQKPPPELAAIRPNATYAGTPITLFNSRFKVGTAYSVEFTSFTGTKTSVSATAVSRRDLADGVTKPQLVVTVPNMAIGPASVRVSSGKTQILALTDDAFTVVPLPVAVSQEVGSTSYPSFKAAIGRDGTFYLSLDMSAITLPRVFRAQAKGYPLTFTSDDVVFFNIQGFQMQLLNADMPGLYSVESANSTVDSDILGYSRHEFSTFYLQHEERQVHQVLDGNWHVDGTRHVDHDHLILAISGVLQNGADPRPGATPSFTLELDRFTLFQNGLAGVATGSSVAAIDIGSSATTDSYNSRTGTTGHQGNVLSNSLVRLSGSAVIDGDAKGAGFDLTSGADITGAMTPLAQPVSFMPVKTPDLLSDLGDVTLTDNQRRTISSGSYVARQIALANTSRLYIDNCTGPVTIYLNGPGGLTLSKDTVIETCDPNPEKFAVYGATDAPVTLSGAGTFHGVVYAPQSVISVGNTCEFFGAFVGQRLLATGTAKIHYDTALQGQ